MKKIFLFVFFIVFFSLFLNKILAKQTTTELQKCIVSGTIHFRKNNYLKSAKYFLKAAELSNKSEQKFELYYKSGKSFSLFAEKIKKNSTDFFYSSIKCFQNSLKFYKNKEQEKKVILELRKIILERGDFVVSESNYTKILEIIKYYEKLNSENKIFEKIAVKNKLVLLQNSINNIYLLQSEKLIKKKKYDSALEELYKIKKKTPNYSNLDLKIYLIYFYKNRFLVITVGSILGIALFLIIILIKLKLNRKKEIKPAKLKIEKMDRKFRRKIFFLGLLSEINYFKTFLEKVNEQHIAAVKKIIETNKVDFNNVYYYEYLIKLEVIKFKDYLELSELYSNNGFTDTAIKTLLNINLDVLEKNELLIYYLKLAELFQKSGNINLAIRQINNAINIEPKNEELYMKIGDLNCLNRNYVEASTNYYKAFEINNKLLKNIEIKYELLFHQSKGSEKLLILEQLEKIFLKIDDDNKLVEIYESFVALTDFKDKNYLAKLGRIYLKKEFSKKAFEIFQKIVELNPEPNIYKILSLISRKLEDFYNEEFYLKKYVESLDKIDKTYLDRLIELYKINNKFDELFCIYQKGVTLYPQEKNYYKGIINTLINKKMYLEFYDELRHFLQNFPDEIDFIEERVEIVNEFYENKKHMFKTLIDVYADLGDNFKMEQYYLKMFEEFSEDSLVEEKLSLVMIYLKNQRNKEATEIYENILNFEPENIEILSKLGRLYLKLKNMRKAKDVFERLLKIEPENVLANSKMEYIEHIVKNEHILKYQEILNDENISVEQKTEIQISLAEEYFKNGFFKLCTSEIKSLVKLFKKNKVDLDKCFDLITKAYIENKQTGVGIQYFSNFYNSNELNSENEKLVKYHLAELYFANDELPKSKFLFEELLVTDEEYKDVNIKLMKLGDVKSSKDNLIIKDKTTFSGQSVLKKSTLERYEIIKELGRGGMGVVYKAKDNKLDRIVALKQLHADTNPDSESAKRLFIEAKAVAQMNHPNIVNVFDVGDSEDELFITMEFVEGETLTEYLKKNDRMDLELFKNVSLQICLALSYAHAHQIIHRDIKPDNIMLKEDFKIKIMDFGLAKQMNTDVSLTQEGIAMGTAKYMSPEQIKGEDIDNRTDIYALGCLFYEILSGKPPFDSENMNALIYKHLTVEPDQLKELVPEVNDNLNNVIMKCLTKNIEERYSNVDELILDLKNA